MIRKTSEVEAPPEPTVGPRSTVSLRAVSLGYGRTTVLSDVDLDLQAGTITALIGPNGAGKSTLLNAMGGLWPPTRGRVTVLGEDPRRARRRIAYVLQSTRIAADLPITAGQVVAMGRYPTRGPFGRFDTVDRTAIARAMDRMAVTDLATRQLSALSGGQRQRVFVAQGLAQEADVVLLDEPLGGLDAVSQQHILDALAVEREAGRTVVVSTHDLAEAAAADQLVLLAGHVVAAGRPGAVLTEENLARAYGGRLLRLPQGGLLVDDGSHHHH